MYVCMYSECTRTWMFDMMCFNPGNGSTDSEQSTVEYSGLETEVVLKVRREGASTGQSERASERTTATLRYFDIPIYRYIRSH